MRQSTLHQLKGHIPLLCTETLAQMLIAEFKFMQEHHQVSTGFGGFLQALSELGLQIDNYLAELESRA